MKALICEGAGQRKGNTWLFQNISFSLPKGSCLAVLGPSGSGKTSLLRTIGQLSALSEGEISVLGCIWNKDQALPTISYPRLAYVSQGYPLWPYKTPKMMLDVLNLADRSQHFRDYWSALGIDQLEDKFPHQMSAGQRQRVAFALALSVSFEVLLLDEITSAQDVEFAALMSEIVQDILSRQQTVLFSSHQLQFASHTATDFIFLDKGCLIETGPVDQLKNPNTDRLEKFRRFM